MTFSEKRMMVASLNSGSIGWQAIETGTTQQRRQKLLVQYLGLGRSHSLFKDLLRLDGDLALALKNF